MALKTIVEFSLSFLCLFFIIIIIIIPAYYLEASVLKREFIYVKKPKQWNAALLYCREQHTTLAMLRTVQEAEMLKASWGKHHTWVGLHRDIKRPSVWRWTGDLRAEDASQHSSWADRQPENRNCTFIWTKSTEMYSQTCSTSLFFLCSDKNKSPSAPLHYVRVKKTWHEARQHCIDHYSDLATIRRPPNRVNFKREHQTWIGLFHAKNGWQWAGGEESSFRKWAKRQPDNHDCGSVALKSRQLFSDPCSDSHPFICFEDNLLLVKENKTWEEALEHCRAIAVDRDKPHRYRSDPYDLVSLTSEDDHLYARDGLQGATTDQVWTGLRFLAGYWLWVNGEKMEYQGLPVCPAQRQHCGTLPKDNTKPWNITDCTERRNFLCYMIDPYALPPPGA